MDNNAMMWFIISRHPDGNITTGNESIDFAVCIILFVLLATPVLVPAIYFVVNWIGDWIDNRRRK